MEGLHSTLRTRAAGDTHGRRGLLWRTSGTRPKRPQLVHRLGENLQNGENSCATAELTPPLAYLNCEPSRNLGSKQGGIEAEIENDTARIDRVCVRYGAGVQENEEFQMTQNQTVRSARCLTHLTLQSRDPPCHGCARHLPRMHGG